MSRNPTDDESDAGAKGDDHKVFRHCLRAGCGNRSEIDHKTNTGQAEAKNVNQFDSFKQMRRNKTIQKQTGASITYKINGKNENVQYVKAQIEYAAKVVNLRVTVKIV